MKFLTILCLSGALLFSFPHPVNSSSVSKPLQQKNPLTLKQIEGLIQNRTPDSAIALEIEQRSVAFQIDEETIKRLRVLGAGSRTIQALESRRDRIEQSRKNNESPPEKIVVLVANFGSLDNENYTVTELLLTQLRESTADYPDIKIEPLGETITALQGRDVARAKGKEHNASIVLWGWISKSREKALINAHFEVLRELQSYSLPNGKQTYITPLSELDEFSLQTRLSNDLTSVTLAATAIARLEAQDYTGAISRFTEALNQRKGPNEIIDVTDIYAWRGLAYFVEAVMHGADMLDRAIGDFDKVISLDETLDEKSIAAYMLRALCYIVKEDYDKAISDMKKLLELESNPFTRAYAYHYLSILYDIKKESKQASDYRNKAKQIIEELPPDFMSYFLRAQAYVMTGDYNEALNNYDKALNLRPDALSPIDIYFSKGNIYLEQDRLDEALNEFNKILQLDAKHVFAYWRRGYALTRKRDYNSAIGNYNTAIQLNPRLAEAYGDRGDAYRYKGNHEQALKDYDKALELKPDLAIGYFYRGNLYRDKGQFDKALQDYEIYIKYEPEDVDGYWGRVAIYTLLKNYDAAISDYEKLIQLDPTNPITFFSRGSSYWNKGNLDKALSDYDEAIKMQPDFALVYLSRASIHVLKGNRQQAISDLQKVLQLSKDAQLRQQAEQLLQQLGVQ